MAGDWSEFEVEAVVTDYFAMLLKELRGEGFNKAAHRHALTGLLNDRSDGSVEFKHQNISAVLIESGYPYVAGYKPRWNYQQLLADAVRARLQVDRRLERAVCETVEAEADAAEAEDILSRLEPPPEATEPEPPGFDHAGEDRLRSAPRSTTWSARPAIGHWVSGARNSFLPSRRGGFCRPAANDWLSK
jgi:hypothetical protein